MIIYNGILFGRKRSGPLSSCRLLNTLFLHMMYKRKIAVCEPCDVNGVINCRTFARGYKDCGQCHPLVAHFKPIQKIYSCWYIWENNWLPWLQHNYSSFNHQWNQNHSLQLAGWYSLPPVMTDFPHSTNVRFESHLLFHVDPQSQMSNWTSSHSIHTWFKAPCLFGYT